MGLYEIFLTPLNKTYKVLTTNNLDVKQARDSWRESHQNNCPYRQKTDRSLARNATEIAY